MQWILDAKKSRNPRMFFLTEEGKNSRNATMRLYRGKTECRTEKVYIMVVVIFFVELKGLLILIILFRKT